jgi:hypothetical protein
LIGFHAGPVSLGDIFIRRSDGHRAWVWEADAQGVWLRDDLSIDVGDEVVHFFLPEAEFRAEWALDKESWKGRVMLPPCAREARC